MPYQKREAANAYQKRRYWLQKASRSKDLDRCRNGGCTRSVYRGRYCYRCWVGTKWFSLTARVRNLNGKCRNYLGVPLLLTREEFIQWAMDNPPPADMKQPSLDRKVSARGYAMGNIQWLELRQNSRGDALKYLPLTHRRCPKCKTIFPLTTEFFYRSSAKHKMGFASRCKACKKQK